MADFKNANLEARYAAACKTVNFELQGACFALRMDMEKLYDMASSIERDMAQLKQRLEHADFAENLDGKFYVGLNSLGELQAKGPGLDVQVALMERSVRDLNHAIRDEIKARAKAREEQTLKQHETEMEARAAKVKDAVLAWLKENERATVVQVATIWVLRGNRDLAARALRQLTEDGKVVVNGRYHTAVKQ